MNSTVLIIDDPELEKKPKDKDFGKAYFEDNPFIDTENSRRRRHLRGMGSNKTIKIFVRSASLHAVFKGLSGETMGEDHGYGEGFTFDNPEYWHTDDLCREDVNIARWGYHQFSDPHGAVNLSFLRSDRLHAGIILEISEAPFNLRTIRDYYWNALEVLHKSYGIGSADVNVEIGSVKKFTDKDFPTTKGNVLIQKV